MCSLFIQDSQLAREINLFNGDTMSILLKLCEYFNPLTLRRTQVSLTTEISILFKEGIIKNCPMSVAPMSR